MSLFGDSYEYYRIFLFRSASTAYNGFNYLLKRKNTLCSMKVFSEGETHALNRLLKLEKQHGRKCRKDPDFHVKVFIFKDFIVSEGYDGRRTASETDT